MIKLRNIKITEWDKKFPINKHGYVSFSMCIFAPRGSGKTYFIKWLLKDRLKGRFDLIYVFSSTADENYADVIRKPFRFNELDEKKLRKIFIVNSLSEKKRNILILFDDQEGDNLHFSNTLLKAYSNGRHYNLSVIFSTQNPQATSTRWQSNSDFLVCFKQNPRNTEYVIKNLLTGILDFKQNNYKKSTEIHYNKQILKHIVDEKYRMAIVRPLLSFCTTKKHKSQPNYFYFKI